MDVSLRQPSVVSGGFSRLVESAWTLWAPCCLALQVVSAARLRSIAGCQRMRTSSLSWKGRIQGTAMGTPASMSLTSQGISLPWKSGGRCPARPAPPRPSSASPSCPHPHSALEPALCSPARLCSQPTQCIRLALAREMLQGCVFQPQPGAIR